jgi:hypothetical protein
MAKSVKPLEGGKAACVVITGDQCRYAELLAGYDAKWEIARLQNKLTLFFPKECT